MGFFKNVNNFRTYTINWPEIGQSTDFLCPDINADDILIIKGITSEDIYTIAVDDGDNTDCHICFLSQIKSINSRCRSCMAGVCNCADKKLRFDKI